MSEMLMLCCVNTNHAGNSSIRLCVVVCTENMNKLIRSVQQNIFTFYLKCKYFGTNISSLAFHFRHRPIADHIVQPSRPQKWNRQRFQTCSL